MTQTERSITISPQDLMVLGLQKVAYIKPVTVEGKSAFAIHTADGREVAVMADLQVALAAVRQNEMEPVSVH
jgi:hypothetical protein